ncbi:hypothetical protein OIU76_012832 [Salix suchowensis]|uniref:Legumain prodomain domain-containing protein n=1 Tax=Salix suchowensis TaxID=1278906 RepID=A0ABQ9A703_9ROSI|nr:hypothetical protein OIU76_012832 [Salix suchowensis]KAJ6323320.1 hypothetical protein OIU77_013026 [Salix suchowensis]
MSSRRSHVCGYGTFLFLIIALLSSIAQSQEGIVNSTSASNLPSSIRKDSTAAEEKQWAVLVAGSAGYENYRHQADVCHAYQILKKGGLKDENIVVFMYDDIAFHVDNPRPGTIINKPFGHDVYAGVPKDYTGDNCTVDNLFAVLLGNKSALTGGSGKVIDSGPNDNIFIYYADHGAPGLVGMPVGKDLYAKDLIEVFKKQREASSYKSMVFYLEACESGTMFEGLLPSNWSIYAVTAANGEESSYGVYCPEFYPYPPSEFSTCLGDVFSISWMEDSDLHDTSQETLQQQYEVVRRRTGFDYEETSHVMQYGNMELSKELLSLYIGTNAADDNYTANSNNIEEYPSRIPRAFDQREATLLHFLHKYQRAPDGSAKKVEAHRDLAGIHSHIRHVDRSINHIAAALFGDENAANAMEFVRPSGQPLVDDWDCFKELVRAYEKQCGGLSWYGKKYTRVIANMCNAGINVEQMIGASTGACSLPSKDETDRN